MATKLVRKKKPSFSSLSLLNWLDSQLNVFDFWSPDWDIDGVKSKKEDSSIKYFFDVPGLEREDISIDLEDGYLIVKGRSKNEYVSNRYYSVYVGNVDSSNISATLDKGILTMEIPKESKNKIKITVK